jgi:hypothetical protein
MPASTRPSAEPHVPDKADLVKDLSGTKFVLMHCARCGSEVAMKRDAERNIVERGFCRTRRDTRHSLAARLMRNSTAR